MTNRQADRLTKRIQEMTAEWEDAFGFGNCGAIAGLFRERGLGQIAYVEVLNPSNGLTFPHFVNLTTDGQIYDLTGVTEPGDSLDVIDIFPPDELPDLYGEAEISWWRKRLTSAACSLSEGFGPYPIDNRESRIETGRGCKQQGLMEKQAREGQVEPMAPKEIEMTDSKNESPKINTLDIEAGIKWDERAQMGSVSINGEVLPLHRPVLGYTSLGNVRRGYAVEVANKFNPSGIFVLQANTIKNLTRKVESHKHHLVRPRR